MTDKYICKNCNKEFELGTGSISIVHPEIAICFECDGNSSALHYERKFAGATLCWGKYGTKYNMHQTPCSKCKEIYDIVLQSLKEVPPTETDLKRWEKGFISI